VRLKCICEYEAKCYKTVDAHECDNTLYRTLQKMYITPWDRVLEKPGLQTAETLKR
jgi:hypothetical protein